MNAGIVRNNELERGLWSTAEQQRSNFIAARKDAGRRAAEARTIEGPVRKGGEGNELSRGNGRRSRRDANHLKILLDLN